MGLDGKPKVDSGANGFARIVEGVQMGFDGRISVAAMTDKGLVVSTGMAVQTSIKDDAEHGDLGDDYPFQFCGRLSLSF